LEIKADKLKESYENWESVCPCVGINNKSAIFSRKYKVSVYDAVYAVLAQDKGCVLITADSKFVDQVNLPFVKKLG